MPNTESALKRMRTSKKRRDLNRVVKGRIASTHRKFSESLESGDKGKSQELFRQYYSFLDKGVKQGSLKANTASRRKSRAAVRLSIL